MDVKRLLAESKALLAKFDQPEDWQAPKRQLFCVEFLIDEFFDVPVEQLTHSFSDKPFPENETTVIHGHPSYGHCVASAFCHINGYRPSAVNSPAFRRQFEMKWKYNGE